MYRHPDLDLSMETIRRVKRGERYDPVGTRVLVVFNAVSVDNFVDGRYGKIYLGAQVLENSYPHTCSWNCLTEEEALKWFNAYVELYGPPLSGEFLGFKYGNGADEKIPETGRVRLVPSPF